jgi:hypothetical protein
MQLPYPHVCTASRQCVTLNNVQQNVLVADFVSKEEVNLFLELSLLYLLRICMTAQEKKKTRKEKE